MGSDGMGELVMLRLGLLDLAFCNGVRPCVVAVVTFFLLTPVPLLGFLIVRASYDYDLDFYGFPSWFGSGSMLFRFMRVSGYGWG